MKKATVVWLIVAAALLLVGSAVFITVMSINNWNFDMLSTVQYETREYTIDENFANILIETDTAGVTLVPSTDGKCRVVVRENEKAKHSVSVQNNSLDIRVDDTRKWFDHIGIFSTESPRITVYIPVGEYGNLNINTSTGAVEIPEQFKFDTAEINVSTGAVKYFASAKDKVKIESSTGAVTVGGITAAEIEIDVSTGAVSISNSAFSGEVNITVSTGKAEVSGVECKRLVSDGDTGKLYLKDVIASDMFNIERDTGDVLIEACDAAVVFIETDTGDVKCSFLTEKVVFASSDTGRIDVPKSSDGGKCEVKTDTGDIEISIK